MSMIKRFRRGESTYKCQVCGRATRNTGGDEGNTRLCFQCYELAGIENHPRLRLQHTGIDESELKFKRHVTRLSPEVKQKLQLPSVVGTEA